ncbi:hypothetical protein BX661DRAFT_179739 [Kickxella alabastrina]|uniref:uncharacterized protein n=1 Tax=Kickxella alabastrina TaxID=61397 RepID=UPI00221E8E36|nr:uncharacterized protein BX661DRAFT_179739 [Kickxella alabastrina]KAI7832066.1 hypothetical protein BX661DRAFT_179739 [Kickxella alabastrina]
MGADGGRRQSLRLLNKALQESDKEEQATSNQQPSIPKPSDTPGGRVLDGRVEKRSGAGRIIPSRYMSNTAAAAAAAGTPAAVKKTAGPRVRAAIAALTATPATSAALPRPGTFTDRTAAPAMAPVCRPYSAHRQLEASNECLEESAAVRRALPPGDSRTAERLQWQLLLARSQMQFDSAKSAAQREINQLVGEAEEAKRALFEEQRKLKVMQELVALDSWINGSAGMAVREMGRVVGEVAEAYLRFGRGMQMTTRAMPVAGVWYEDEARVVADLERFVAEVAEAFPPEDPRVRSVFCVAEALRQFCQGRREEARLGAECGRLKASLEHVVALAESRHE